MPEDSVFEAATNGGDQNQSFLDKYVGDGKKYKDVEELAKAYEHANRFIPELKNDLNSMKEFMSAQFGELAKNSKGNSEPPANPNGSEGGEQHNPAPASPPKDGDGKEVDLKELIRQATQELSQEERLKKNAEITEAAMLKHFGSKEAAVDAVRQKAEELNVSPQWLADSAFQSPKAFFGVMGISEEAPKSSNTPSSSSDVNPQRLDALAPKVKPGTYQYYEHMRKTDPKRYAKLETQSQLMADAMRLGDDFFKR